MRLAARAKRGLNTRAVEQRTAERLAERDPTGQVLSWRRVIDKVAPDYALATPRGS